VENLLIDSLRLGVDIHIHIHVHIKRQSCRQIVAGVHSRIPIELLCLQC